MDQQLCWVEKLQILHAVCHLHFDLLRPSLPLDGSQLLFFADSSRLKKTYEKRKLQRRIFAIHRSFCRGGTFCSFYLGAALGTNRVY